MERRGSKLRQCLALVMARLGDGQGLQRVEIESPAATEVLIVEGDQLQGAGGKKLPLPALPLYLEELFNEADKGTIRFVERGTLLTIAIKGREATLAISTLDAPRHQQPVETGTRQNFIKVGEALELLQALAIASPAGKVRADKRRKFYQVDRFVELVDEIVGEWREKRPLTILDCGCGKSYLSFVLNYWLVEKRRIPCRIIGIDENENVIQASRDIQKRLNYRNMEFRQSSILAYKPTGPVDMVLSLHACDTATDEALAQGIHLKSKYIIAVPCCQAALRERLDYSPWEAVAKHSIFRNRLADVLTDGMRTSALTARGYKVSVVEYVSPLATPKNIMIRAMRTEAAGNSEPYERLQTLVEGSLPLEECLKLLENTD